MPEDLVDDAIEMREAPAIVEVGVGAPDDAVELGLRPLERLGVQRPPRRLLQRLAAATVGEGGKAHRFRPSWKKSGRQTWSSLRTPTFDAVARNPPANVAPTPLDDIYLLCDQPAAGVPLIEERRGVRWTRVPRGLHRDIPDRCVRGRRATHGRGTRTWGVKPSRADFASKLYLIVHPPSVRAVSAAWGSGKERGERTAS